MKNFTENPAYKFLLFPIGQISVFAIGASVVLSLITLLLAFIFKFNVTDFDLVERTMLILPQVIINGVTIGFVYATIALGYTMVYGVLEFINFSHSEIFMVGGIVGTQLMAYFEHIGVLATMNEYLVIALAIVLAMAVSGSLAVVVERLAYKPLRGAPKLVPLISAIGMSFFLQDAVRLILSLTTGEFNVILPKFGTFDEFWKIAIPGKEDPLRIQIKSVIMVGTAVLMLLGLNFLVNGTKVGTAIRAVAQDRPSLVSAKQIPSAGWVVQMALPTTEAFAPIRDMNRHAYELTGGLTLLATLGIWLLIRRALKPLDKATSDIRGMAMGTSDIHSLPLQGDCEIQDLLASFNALVEHRKEAEQSVASRDFAQNLIRTANVLIVELDLAGNVKLVNPAAELVTGYRAEELIGRDWFEILVPKDRYPAVWNMFQEHAEKGLPKHFENPILTKTGEVHYIIWQNSDQLSGSSSVPFFPHGATVGRPSGNLRRPCHSRQAPRGNPPSIRHAAVEIPGRRTKKPWLPQRRSTHSLLRQR